MYLFLFFIHLIKNTNKQFNFNLNYLIIKNVSNNILKIVSIKG